MTIKSFMKSILKSGILYLFISIVNILIIYWVVELVKIIFDIEFLDYGLIIVSVSFSTLISPILRRRLNE